MKNKMQILIVEDLRIVREGIKVLLSVLPEVKLIGECKNGKEFLDFIAKKLPDVVLMDNKMPVMTGMEAIEIAQKEHPDMKFIILTMSDDKDCLLKAINMGIKGYLLKNTDAQELWTAISNVCEGKSYFSNELLTTLSECLLNQKMLHEEKQSMTGSLTKREMEILYLIVEKGYDNKKIAEACSISPRTAGGHRANIFKKTGSRRTSELILNAYKNHLVGHDGRYYVPL
ncbi:MAG: response regulator transcription factor [Bacteroidota bacterium]